MSTVPSSGSRAVPVRPSARRVATPFTDEDYRSILTFRTRLRQFLSWSAEQARAEGLTAAQHQLLLAVRGHPDPEGPTISEIAEYLQLRHHSAVGLVDRAVTAKLVRRHEDPGDRRLARVQLEPAGAAALERLTALHVAELHALASGDVLPHLRDQPDRPARRASQRGPRRTGP
ncbi:MAG TPA: MarR family transcriptional regulator [Acidimicrobiales bacterium]|nr:MarR family transcriptional regulator [Acidimicrobiales bacterium]